MARPSLISALSIGDLKSLIAEKKSRVTGLKKERAKLLKRLAQLDKEIGGSSTAGRRGTRPKNTMPLPDAIEAVLKSGKPLGVPAIAAAVQENGYKSSSPKFTAIVNQALIKDKKRFVKVERGVYSLKK
jgi:hypothetical protein